jgi:guanylate kinase
MLIIITGPTGSGKSSLVVSAQSVHGWQLIKTLTTRPLRSHNGSDTKEQIPPTKMTTLLSVPAEFRSFCYEGYEYATPLVEAQKAARCRNPISIIDWVHPHPEDLSFLGQHVLALVLLPTLKALENRLREAHREDRIMRAVNERQQILSRLTSYKSPWMVHVGDVTVEHLAEFLWLIIQK